MQDNNNKMKLNQIFQITNPKVHSYFAKDKNILIPTISYSFHHQLLYHSSIENQLALQTTCL